MVLYQNAKINLGLNIVRRRPDGYHDLETIFYPVPIHDILEVTPLSALPQATFEGIKNQVHILLDGQLYFLTLGNAIDCPPEKNLIVKAFSLLAGANNLPPTLISLHKHIPSGAGLGGGSANASFVLKMLNEVYQLNITENELEKLASKLGADCAFFIRNKPVFAEGIGDIFTPIELSLKGYHLLILKPDIFVSTREAFAQVQPQQPQRSLKEIVQLPVKEWRSLMRNDFEDSVFPQYPAIGNLKQQLYDNGALYAAMSGSGSSVFGIFAPSAPSPTLSLDKATFISPYYTL